MKHTSLVQPWDALQGFLLISENENYSFFIINENNIHMNWLK